MDYLPEQLILAMDAAINHYSNLDILASDRLEQLGLYELCGGIEAIKQVIENLFKLLEPHH
jgi:hypothetical protein